MLNIKKPTLILNERICKKNISAMAAKARNQGVHFRPHFKTHQSAEIGEWFRNEGVTAITVSSVSMAHYFADSGWKDITIAFPVNILEIDEINELSSSIHINLLIESVETAFFLTEKITHPCGYFVKIDTGYHRTGIVDSDISLVEKVIQSANSPRLHFKGFLTHSGNSYQIKDKAALQNIQNITTERLLRLKKLYQGLYPEIIVSVGDTPTCSQLAINEGIDEIRPGNFVFYDVMQLALGSCKPEDIAVALVCPVVAIHPERNEVVIYGGAIHVSKESVLLQPSQKQIFGLVVRWDGNCWNANTLLGSITSISQEHGIISTFENACNLKPGDLVAVLPVHSCLTAHLMRTYLVQDGRVMNTMNS